MIESMKRLLRWGKVTAPGSDDKQFPVQQIEYMGKTADSMVLFPYGVHGNLPADALALIFAVQGDESNRAIIGGTPQNRPKMAAGENCVYHPPTGSIVHFKDNGDIDITTETDVNVTAANVNVTAEADVNVTATNANVTADSVTVTATTVTVDAPNTTFTGDVQIDGALNVDGDINSLANIIAAALLQGATLTVSGAGSIGGKDFGTHIHVGSPSAPSGGVSNTGAIV